MEILEWQSGTRSPQRGWACSDPQGLLTASPDQTQPPVFFGGLTGLRYQGVFKFLPARAFASVLL
ncbi:MAG TPA: hypothetical protein VHV10_09225 [Ktedonobacteraceae bacterium]|nr:hypothetical protein [Ktedonobacteraceae bacterium]